MQTQIAVRVNLNQGNTENMKSGVQTKRKQRIFYQILYLQLIQTVHNYMSIIQAQQNKLELDQILSDSGSESDEFQNLSFGDDSQANQSHLASEIFQPPTHPLTSNLLRLPIDEPCQSRPSEALKNNQRESLQILYNKTSSLNQKKKQENQLNLAIESLEFNNICYQRLSSQNQTDEEWKLSETTTASAQIQHIWDENLILERKYSLGEYGDDQIYIQILEKDIYATLDTTTIPITFENLEKITCYYYQHQIPVPIVSYEVFSKGFAPVYIKYYLMALFEINKGTLVEIMKKIEQKSFQIPKLKHKWVFEIITKIYGKYSKPEFLKHHLDKKLSILEGIYKNSEEGKKQMKTLFDQIAKVQMLISFQKAIEYIRNEESYSSRKKVIQIECKKQYKRWVKRNCKSIDI